MPEKDSQGSLFKTNKQCGKSEYENYESPADVLQFEKIDITGKDNKAKKGRLKDNKQKFRHGPYPERGIHPEEMKQPSPYNKQYRQKADVDT